MITNGRGTAIVTGAGRGIGRAIAHALADAGFDVVMASVEPEPREFASRTPSPPRRRGPSVIPDADDADDTGSPPSRGRRETESAATPGEEREGAATQDDDHRDGSRGRLHYEQFDLADLDAHAALVERAVARFGPITCLVNNAGVTSLVRGDMLALSRESFDRSVAINLRGTFFLSQAVAKHCLATPDETRYRSLVTISSANAELVGENRADYCITKAALAMMSKLFAARLADAGIGVFDVRPGIIATDMTAPARAKYDPFIREGGVPMRRWGAPDDVAKVVATIARGDLPFTTGVHIDVGGGLQLHRL